MTTLFSYLYEVFTSIKTTIVLFAFFMLFFLIGNVLPYGGSYEQIKATGLIRKVIEGLDLLNIYSGPWFLTTVGLFFLNLSLCTYKRFMWMVRVRRPVDLTTTTLSAHRNTQRFNLPYGPEETVRRVESFFRRRLFLKKSCNIYGREVCSGGVFEQGFIHYVWVSLSYHLSMILAVIGATVTFLFAFESELTLYPGEPLEVAAVSANTRWNKWTRAQKEPVIPEEEKFQLELREFSIKYTQTPAIGGFPARGFAPRLKETMKLGGLTVAPKEDAFYPIEFTSELIVCEKGVPRKEALVKVNTPLRYRGLTFYQTAYDYRFALYAGEEKAEKDPEGKYKLPGIEGHFSAQQVISGTLYLKDGSPCALKPFVKLVYELPKGEGGGKPEVFKLYQGEPRDIKGVKARVEGIHAGTILSYRHDPGVPILWIAAPVLFFGMLFRAWGRWYRASYIVEKTPEGSVLYVNLQRVGLWGDETRMVEKLRDSLGETGAIGTVKTV